jgi:hypothetical protein
MSLHALPTISTWFSYDEVDMLENVLNEFLLGTTTHDKANHAQSVLKKLRDNKTIAGLVAKIPARPASADSPRLHLR